jgi:virulence-associated protein VapD
MERKYYKAINFDLDTNGLKKYYVRYQQAYIDLRRFFKEHGFSHRQGSGYISNKKLSTADIIDLIGEMKSQFDWTGDCVKKIDVTNIGTQYDLIELLRPDESDDDFSL